ncbi:MAG TPA: hypothetical protein VM735_07335 [Candidatus Kapabacteria bacterium]|jgi:hypothetical protein|nr:hypothetical protein [Candidatus Kapabacteria bacterium]
MDTPEQKELEQFIHQQLKKLPEREAPGDLMANVFAAINARESAPWWKQPFTSWPRNTQALLFGALSVLFAAIVYAVWSPAEAINTNALVERASSFAWLGRVLDALASGALLAFRNLSWEWLVAFAVVLAAMYGACVATGFALYRITARHGTSAVHS